MKLLFRYLAIGIVKGYAIVALALLALFGLFEFMEQANDIGEGQYSIGDAILVVSLTTPSRLMDLASFVALLGTAYGLGSFVATHELTVVRAAGVSPARVSAVVVVATLVLFGALLVNETIARPLYQRANLFQMSETSDDGSLYSSEGTWIVDDNEYVHIESFTGNRLPRDISVFDFGDDLTLDQYLHADEAEIVAESKWLLSDVVEKEYFGARIETDHMASIDYLPTWPENTRLYEVPIEGLSLGALRDHIRYLERSGADGELYALEFWRRCLLPVSGIAFSLFAVPFVMSVRPRAGIGIPISIGIAAALLIYVLQQIMSNLVVLSGAPPVVATLLPIVIVLAAALAMVRRVNRSTG